MLTWWLIAIGSRNWSSYLRVNDSNPETGLPAVKEVSYSKIKNLNYKEKSFLKEMQCSNHNGSASPSHFPSPSPAQKCKPDYIHLLQSWTVFRVPWPLF